MPESSGSKGYDNFGRLSADEFQVGDFGIAYQFTSDEEYRL